jgi:hypothetical protein
MRGAERKKKLFLRKFLVLAIATAGILAVALSCSGYASSLSDQEMRKIWLNNGAVQGEQAFQFGVVDWISGTVFVEGSSPLMGNTPQGKLLAGRRAVVQAQKKLLYLLYELRYGLPRRIASIEVEGQVVMGHVDRRGVRNGDYVVEVALPLRRLLEECVLWKATVR